MRKSTIVSVVVAILLAVPLTLYASHQFADVPNDHTFHEAIAWMADNGITQGCNPPANTNYCPENSVTRGQMAGFMKRFYDNLVAGAGVGLGFAARGPNDPPDSGNGVINELSLNLQIPQAGALVVSGGVQMANVVEPDLPFCGINFGSAPSTAQGNSLRSVDLLISPLATCETATVVSVNPGTQQVRMVMLGAFPTTDVLQGNLSAVLYTADGLVLLSPSDDAVEAPVVDKTPKGE